MMKDLISRKITRALTVILICLFFMPLLVFPFGIIKNKQLANTEYNKAPALRWKSLSKGTFQEVADKWLFQKTGIWSWLVYLENNLNYEIFNLTGERLGGTTLVSKDGALIDRIYVNDYNGIYKSNSNNVDKTISALKKLQSELAKSNIPLLIFIHPNKAVFKPEWISWWHKSPEPAQRYIDKFLPELQKAGIPFIKVSDSLPKDLQFFTKSGAHLTNYGKCLSAKLMSDYLGKLFPGRVPDFNCEISNRKVRAEGEDLDLARLLNVSNPSKSIERVNASRITNIKDPVSPRLKVLISGTSYLFGTLSYLREAKAYDTCSFLFYTASQYFTKLQPDGEYTAKVWPFSKKGYNLNMLKKFNVVILEATEARLHQLGFGLLNQFSQDGGTSEADFSIGGKDAF